MSRPLNPFCASKGAIRSWVAAACPPSALIVIGLLMFCGTAPAGPYDWEIFAGNRGGAGFRDGSGQGVRFNSPYGIARDGAGNFYVADSENHLIRKITPAGVVTTLAGRQGNSGSEDGIGSAARFKSPRGIAADAAGTVYVSDTGNYTIRRITPDGVVTTIAGTPGGYGSANGGGSVARFSGVWSITWDASSGNLYAADYYSHTIRKITPGGVVTRPAGSAFQNSFTDGTGSAARFTFPSGIASDAAGNIYITAGNIRKMTPAGVVTTVAGAPNNLGFQDGTGINARFNNPAGLVVESGGNLLVGDNHSIRRVTPAGVVTTLAGNVNPGSTDATGLPARFNSPTGLTLDSAGTLFVADFNNHAIRRMTTARAVSTFSGGPLLAGSADGTGENARFHYPMGMASDAAGFLYVADAQNSTVRKISPAGQVTTLAGTAGISGMTDATGPAARFNQPHMLAVDSQGNVFVADRLNHAIRRITPAGVVTTFAGVAGQPGWEDGIGNLARFTTPDGIAVGPDDTLYVAEAPEHRIRKITPAAVVTTLAGSSAIPAIPGSADGIGAAARFNHPRGLAVDRQGNIFVADSHNHLIRKITPQGVVTTIAGQASSPASVDGQGSAARFMFPLSVAVDASGFLSVTDTGNHTIRRITPSGMVTTVGGKSGVPVAREGRGTEAQCSSPSGIAIGPGGVLFVADSGNDLIIRGTPVPPLAEAATVSAMEDAPKIITLTGINFEGGPLGFSIVSPPRHGTLTGTLPVLTYTPALNYHGSDSFTFRVNDGRLDSLPATVSISVAPVNDPPVFTAALPDIDAGAAAPDSLFNLLPLLRDPDANDTHTWRISGVSNPSIFASLGVMGGQLAVSYAPWLIGNSIVTVEVKDAAGETAQMPVLITLPVLPAPEAASSGAPRYNSQTGLWEQRITLRNLAQRAIGGFEATVSGLPADVLLFNGSDSLGANPVVGYYQPLAAGATVTMVLEFHGPSLIAPWQPVIATALALPRMPDPSTTGGLAVDRVLSLPGHALLIEFTAVPGQEYLVQYSPDGDAWIDSPLRVRAAGSRVQWIDEGFPRTNIKPPADGSRFYRVRASVPPP